MTIAENRAKWLAALRSGKYAQGRHALKAGKAFCCLGVACDVSGLGKWVSGEYGYSGYAINDRPAEEVGPDAEVCAFFGIDISIRNKAISWNDNDHFSFAEIADLLEEEFNK